MKTEKTDRMLGEHLHLEIRKRMRIKKRGGGEYRPEVAEESRKCCIVLYCENQGSQNCEEISRKQN